MLMTWTKLAIICLVLCHTAALTAQEKKLCCLPYHSFHVGMSAVYEDLYNGAVYRPLAFIYRRNIPLTRKNSPNGFYIYYEPQFHPVIVAEKFHADLGLNAGISYQVHFNDSWYSYLALGSGPHYPSTDSPKQASGFIFSDNVFVGLTKKNIIRNSALDLDLQFRHRHLSNAGLKDPNGGIDNGFLL